MLIQEGMSLKDKLKILTDAAKYDVACTSSGVERRGKKGYTGNAAEAGICHSFSADGRCISLLKILFTNQCIYDCKYCVNRRSNDVVRTAFTPDEVCSLTMEFYKRNYIEGLFLSSGVLHSPDYTMELIYQTLKKLRQTYRFNGYIHVKAIPGADPVLIEKTGFLADRMSVNLELPTSEGLKRLAPGKTRENILKPMRQIQTGIAVGKQEISVYRGHGRQFVPAGQSTQMIVGASPERDVDILRLTQGLYRKYQLKRVFFSAYIPVAENALLPALGTKPPLLREHRLYQADWLLRFYGFDAAEILDDAHPNLDPYLDPKCNWALNHLELFPVDVNRCEYEMLLRVPGIGVKSALRIRLARRTARLRLEDLKKLGVVLKRAQFFIACEGYSGAVHQSRTRMASALLAPDVFAGGAQHLSLFDAPGVQQLCSQGEKPALARAAVRQEALECVAKRL